MFLGQSAGAAASLAIDATITVHDVDYPNLRQVLLRERQLLDYAEIRTTLCKSGCWR